MRNSNKKKFLEESKICVEETTWDSQIQSVLNNFAEESDSDEESNTSPTYLMGLRRKIYKNKGEKECSICLNKYLVGETLTTLKCEHTFHVSCIDKWLKNLTNCPCCQE